MQISAQGAMAAMYRQDVLTNNLANLNTVGYKPDAPVVRQRDAAVQEDGLFHLPSNDMLEALGNGVTAHRNRVSFDQGAIRQTGNPLDVAIEGEGFFVVQLAADGNTSAQRLTRDGRFNLNAAGELVTVSGGLRVLDNAGTPIALDPSQPVAIDGDGTVRQNGAPLAQLQLVNAPNRESIVKEGDGLFNAPPNVMASLFPASGRMIQNAVEEAAVNEIRTMMRITSASGAARRNMQMITYHDRLMDRAINALGRVS